MDLRCPRCGEPLAIDELHGIADENNATFDQVAYVFRTRGCDGVEAEYPTLGLRCSEPLDEQSRATITATYELLGDDVDGAAAMLEDAELLGLLED